MYYRVANPKVIDVQSSYNKDKYGSETITMTVRNILNRKVGLGMKPAPLEPFSWTKNFKEELKLSLVRVFWLFTGWL